MMSDVTPSILSLNISPGGIPKTPVEIVQVTTEGFAGDSHDHDKHNGPFMALSLLDIEDYQDLQAEGYDVFPGATGENITCQNLSIDELQIGDRLRFAGGVEVELTKKRKPCFVLDAIDPRLKEVIVDRCGCLAKVIIPGELRQGETIEVVGREFGVSS